MLSKDLVRFALGGTIVSVFSVFGEVFKPKTFAGMFGAAPSVALVSLALASVDRGVGMAVTSARSMVIGAVGLLAYGAACVMGIRTKRCPVWLAAGAAWFVWLSVSFTVLGVARIAGLVQ